MTITSGPSIRKLKISENREIFPWIGRINLVKMHIVPKAIYRFKVIPIKINTVFFSAIKKTQLFLPLIYNRAHSFPNPSWKKAHYKHIQIIMAIINNFIFFQHHSSGLNIVSCIFFRFGFQIKCFQVVYIMEPFSFSFN